MQVCLHYTIRYLLLIAIALNTVSCEWVKDDLPECPPTEIRLRFEYDYNMLWSDIFKDQIGGLTVFVFDDNNRFVMRKSESSIELLRIYGYEMTFSGEELEVGKEYRFVTIAYQDDENELSQQEGAKFRSPQLQPGDDIASLYVKLDRSDIETPNGAFYVEHQNKPLDILWISRNDCRAELRMTETTRATLNLMRHTNNLTITLRQLDEPAEVDINDFDIRLTDRNGWVDYDNSLRRDDLLAYTPYAEWNTDFKDDDGKVVQRAAHADLSFPRLMYHDDWRKCARLIIYSKKSGATVADINLPSLLVEDRSSLETLRCTEQEFLDREFTYKLDFFLSGGSWEYVEISISVLKWTVRHQGVEM